MSTIKDLNRARLDDKSAVDADVKAAAELDAKLKADTEKSSASTSAFADGLERVGDFFELNPDGTATAYFHSPTAPDRFYSEVLKPDSTEVDAGEVAPPGEVTPTGEVPPIVPPGTPVEPGPTPGETPPPPADGSPADGTTPPADVPTVVTNQ